MVDSETVAVWSPAYGATWSWPTLREDSTAHGLELAVENRGQAKTNEDWLRGVAQMDLHPPVVELLNPFHPGQIHNRTPVNPDELIARQL